VHYPSDIVAGALLGTLVGTVAARSLDRMAVAA
jgi:membrane-associated phospholipid phosphatase